MDHVVALAIKISPDIALMGLNLPDINSIEATHIHLLQQNSNTGILMITVFNDD